MGVHFLIGPVRLSTRDISRMLGSKKPLNSPIVSNNNSFLNTTNNSNIKCSCPRPSATIPTVTMQVVKFNLWCPPHLRAHQCQQPMCKLAQLPFPVMMLTLVPHLQRRLRIARMPLPLQKLVQHPCAIWCQVWRISRNTIPPPSTIQSVPCY